MPDVTAHPAVVWAAVIVAILVILAGGVPKIATSISTSLDVWAKRRVGARRRVDDERDREAAYLSGVAAERLRELQARDFLIAQHTSWDWERYREAVKAGHAIAPPPALLPDLPPLPESQDRQLESEEESR